MSDQAYENTDRLLWRTSDEHDGAYADSVSVTERGEIAIQCGGMVYVRTLRKWHALASGEAQLRTTCASCGQLDGHADDCPALLFGPSEYTP